MRRHLLNLLAVASVLLCAGVVALWIRSDRGSDLVAHLSVAPSGNGKGIRTLHRGAATQPGSVMAWWVAYDFRDIRARDLLDVIGPPGWRVAGAGSPIESPGQPSRFWPVWSPHTEGSSSGWEGFGFAWYAASVDPRLRLDCHFRMVRFPLWLPAAVFAGLPALMLGRRVVRLVRRPRPGRCAACGYDLRATPELPRVWGADGRQCRRDCLPSR